MLKRFFAFLVSFALITNPLMAEGLNRSDLNFAFGQSSAQISKLSSDLSIMTDQQMSETEGEVAPAVVIGVRVGISAYKAYKVYKKAKSAVEAAGRNGGSIKPHTTTKNGKKNKDKHTKKRSGSTNTKQRNKKGWFQR